MTTAAQVSFKNSSAWVSLLNLVYPAGSYYISNVSTSPAGLFGGTWTQVTGRFLYGTTNVNTGGANTVTLTVDQIPSHSHKLYYKTAEFSNGGQSVYWWNSDGNGSWDPSTKTTGGGQAHNNMPAYRGAYMWFRAS